MKYTLQFALTILLAWITGFSSAQTIFFSENFQGGFPAGWTQETSDTTSDGWKVGNSASLSSNDWPIPTHTNFVATNDDGCGADCNKFSDILISPSIDLSSATVPLLKVDVFFVEGSYQGNDENAQIQISTNGGNTFTTIKNLDGASAWQTLEIDVSTYAGMSNVMIAFRYSDGMGWLYGLAVDNVQIIEPDPLDVALTSLDIEDVVTVSHTTPTMVEIKGTIENQGAAVLSSVDINWSGNDGAVNSETIGLNLNFGETYDFTHSDLLSIDKPELSNLTIWLSNANGSNQETNLNNNELSAKVTGSGGTVEKNVLLEEVSGAWCGWCTLGAYLLERLRPDPNIIAVTIHGQSGGAGDDMEIPDGRTLINTYVDGFPQGFIDRTPFATFGDPPAVAIGFSSNRATNERYWDDNIELQKQQATPVSVELTNTFDASSRELVVDLTAHFLGPVEDGNYRVNVYIIEDSVSGSGSGYNQQNYVSSQSGSGGRPGHPYYDDPAVIVGFQHMQVLREMLGGAWGTAGVIPDSIGFNDKFEKQYTFTIPSAWKEKDIFLVGVVKKYDSDINNRPIVNAVEAGLNSTNSTKVTLTYNPEDPTSYIESYLNNDILIQTYPNPANDQLNVELTMKELSNMEVKLVNLMGQEIERLVLDDLQIGKNKIAIKTTGLTDGIYLLNVRSQSTDDQFSERILITH